MLKNILNLCILSIYKIYKHHSFLTDNNGKSIALIPAEEYKELLAIAEMYEDLEDIQAFKDAEGEEIEPLDVFLKRVEENRKKKWNLLKNTL